MKEKFYWRTHFWVFFYAFIFILMILYQATLLFVIKYPELLNFKIIDFFNTNVKVPLDVFSYIWIGVVSIYTGADRAAFAVKTHHMEGRKKDIGDPKILRFVILISLFILSIGVICTAFVDYDFELSQLATAFGSSLIIYIGGQKAISISEVMQKEEYKKFDSDGNGVDDRIDPYIPQLNEIIKNKTIYIYTLDKRNKLVREFEIPTKVSRDMLDNFDKPTTAT